MRVVGQMFFLFCFSFLFTWRHLLCRLLLNTFAYRIKANNLVYWLWFNDMILLFCPSSLVIAVLDPVYKAYPYKGKIEWTLFCIWQWVALSCISRWRLILFGIIALGTESHLSLAVGILYDLALCILHWVTFMLAVVIWCILALCHISHLETMLQCGMLIWFGAVSYLALGEEALRLNFLVLCFDGLTK